MLYGQTAFQCVKEFHEIFGQPAPTEVDWVDEDRVELRFELIREELDELQESYEDGDFHNTIKELADLLYVVNGFAVEMGLDGDEIVQLVHHSNMTKLDENGKAIFREDGKVLKGPNYKPVTKETVQRYLDS